MDITRFEEFRAHVPAASARAYFRTPETGLIPDFVHDGIRRYQEGRYLRGGDAVWLWEGESLGTMDMMDRSREALARMMGCAGTDVAFGQNASQMYNIFVSGFPFQAGDNVVLPAGGWIGSRYAWQNRQGPDLELRYVEPRNGILPAEDFMALCDGRTRAVCVNWVEGDTGFRVDLETLGRFCRERNIWLAVDGVQVLGVLPVDVERTGIDFLTGNDYKWMMNYCGTGYAYISPRLRQVLRQTAAGWMSDAERFNKDKATLRLREDAGRYELGYPTASGVYGLGLVAQAYNRLGREEVAAYVADLSDYLRRQAEEVPGVSLQYDFPAGNRSNTVFLLSGEAPEVLKARLEAMEVDVPLQKGPGGGSSLRVGVHYYNNRSDIDRLCRALRAEK